MIGCIGYIPNISLDEAMNMPESQNAIVELIEKKNSEFTGIQSIMCKVKNGNLYILAETGHPAYSMNEYLQHFVSDTSIENKLYVLVKLDASGGYTIGLIINPQISLKRYGIESAEYNPVQYNEEKILFVQHIPNMVTQPGQFLRSELSTVFEKANKGERTKAYFMWHDFMPGPITDEKIEFDIELFRPQSAEIIFNTNLDQGWFDAASEVIQNLLEGYDNVKPIIIL